MMIFPSLFVYVARDDPDEYPTAHIGRAPFYRARSASTKDGLPAPFSSFLGRALSEHRGLTRPSHRAGDFSISLLAILPSHELIGLLQRSHFNDFDVPSGCQLGEIPVSRV